MSVREEECSPAGPALRIKPGLAIGYRSVLAASAEEISLQAGTHYLLARNGRGKTTLLKTLVGLLKPIAGESELHGACQFVSDGLGFDPEMKARLIFSSLIPRERRDEAFDMASRLELDVGKRFSQLSFGNRKKVGLVMAEFNIDPAKKSVVLFDEPFTGLDAPARELFQEHWASTTDGVLRLLSCHPDFDDMEMPSAVLISNEKIFHGGDGTRTWRDFRTMLN